MCRTTSIKDIKTKYTDLSAEGRISESSVLEIRQGNRSTTESKESSSSTSSSSVPMGAGESPCIEKSQEACGWFESLSPMQQCVILTASLFVFSSTNNLLQEAIMMRPGFEYGVMLGYLPVLGVTIFSSLERKFIAKEVGRVAPFKAYTLITLCLLTSSSFSNMSLNYINFPTKVIFRSCKLIPTTIVATIINRKIFKTIEYASAVAICAGLVLFAAADWNLTPSFDPIGIVLVSVGVCADALLTNAQDKLFTLGASRLEVTLYSSMFTLACMTVTTFASGDLFALIRLARADSVLAFYIVVHTLVSYAAISSYMNVVKRFGGVSAVLITTARKGGTLLLSFIIFPKPFSWFYVGGAALVLGGLFTTSLIKQRNKKTVKLDDQVEKNTKKSFQRASVPSTCLNGNNKNTIRSEVEEVGDEESATKQRTPNLSS